MKLKKVIGLLLIAFVVFWVLSAPDQASNLVRSAISGLGDAANSLSQFVQNLVA